MIRSRKGLESKSWNRAGTKSRIGAENRNRNGKKDRSSLLRAPSANTRLRTMTLQYWGSLHKPSYHLPRIEIHVPWKNEDRRLGFRPEKLHFGTCFLRGKEDVNVSYIMTDDVEGTSRFQASFYLFTQFFPTKNIVIGLSRFWDRFSGWFLACTSSASIQRRVWKCSSM